MNIIPGPKPKHVLSSHRTEEDEPDYELDADHTALDDRCYPCAQGFMAPESPRKARSSPVGQPTLGKVAPGENSPWRWGRSHPKAQLQRSPRAF